MTSKNKIVCPKCKKFYIYSIPRQLTDDPVIHVLQCNFCHHEISIKQNSFNIYLSRCLTVSDSLYKYPVHIDENYGHIVNILDPYKQDMLGSIDESIRLLAKSDAVIVYLMQETFNISFDVIYAKDIFRKIVYMINPIRSSTGWIARYSDDRFEDVDECWDMVINKFLVF